MKTNSIDLGTAIRLTQLYSFPNQTGSKGATLAQTIKHWFDQTLERDGLASQGAKSKVRITTKGEYFLDLTGPDALGASFALYAKRLPQFLANGWEIGRAHV